MSIALHHPEVGYYAGESERIGRQGDFITSPEVSASFGECLALQVTEMDRLLGGGPFTLVELGAGSGRLAEDMLRTFAGSDLSSRLTVILVEHGRRMGLQQRRRLEGCHGAVRVVHAGSLAEASDLVGGGIEGAIVSNELFDALPVHRVVRRQGSLLEAHVTLSREDPPRFETVLLPVDDPALLEYSVRYGVAGEEGMEAEIGLEALRLIREIAQCLRRGFHLAVDYGHSARELYSSLHSRGTLLAYSRHTANEDFFERVGQQDMTSHVNFSALIDQGRLLGLHTAGLTSQDRFLVSFGLAEKIVRLA